MQIAIERMRQQGDALRLYPNGARISERHMEYLRDLLVLCRRHDISATVIITPVQHDFADLTMSELDKQTFAALKTEVRQLCRRQRATYHDFSRIEHFDGQPWEWINVSHMLTENVRRMTNVAYGKPAEYRLRELPDDFFLLRHPPAVHSMNTP